MRPTPTDLQLMDAIYSRYYQDFEAHGENNKTRSSKPHVPICLETVAKDLSIDSEMLFGRLYYHLQGKHGYIASDGSPIDFFLIRVGGDHHCINFPFLSALLADLRNENKKYRIALIMSFVSLIMALVSFIISLLY